MDLRLLTNREKTWLVDALKQTHALPDLLASLGLARSSCFHHRARLRVADKYGDVRRTIADIFESNSPLPWLPPDSRVAQRAGRLDLANGGSA